MELTTYLAIVRRWWRTLVVAVWVAGVSGYAVASQLPPMYETETRILVGPISSDFDTLRASGQLAQTYAELVVSQATLSEVIAEVGVDLSAAELEPFVRAQGNASTRLVNVVVQAATPDLAVRIAQGIARQLQSLSRGGQPVLEGLVTVVDPPFVPLQPVVPQIPLIVILASVAGLAAALVLVVLIDYFADNVNTRRDLAEYPVPFLGIVHRSPRPRRNAHPLVVQASPDSPTANDYRLVAAEFAYSDAPGGRSILVMGTLASEAPGQTAANLAASLQVLGKRVLLVDADGARRVVTHFFGMEDRLGLVEQLNLTDESPIESELKWGLDIVPFGLAQAKLGDRLDGERVRRFVERALDAFDIVLVVASPISDDVSGLLWARIVDRTVVVVQRERTKRSELRRLLHAIEQAGATSIATVLAEDPTPGGNTRPAQPPAPRQAAPAASGRKSR